MTASPSPGALFAALLLGAAGLLVLGGQPLLYGAYVHAGVISEARLGLLAAVEIAFIAGGSAAGIALSRRTGFRMTGLAGIGLIAAGNLAPFLPLFAARAVAGLGGGLLVAIAAQFIAERPNVNVAAGGFLFLQALTQYLLLLWFSASDTAATAVAIQVAIAGLVVATAPLLLLLPRRVAGAKDAASRPADTDRGRPPLSGWLALAAAGLFIGAAVGIWAYLGLWLEQRGISAKTAESMLTASMAGQIAGALVAAGIGERGRSGTRVVAMAMLMLLCVGLLYSQTGAGENSRLLVIAYGFVWMIATPALSGFILEADASRRSLPFAPAAQLCGAALIPTLAGEYLAARSLDLVLLVCAAVLLASLAFLVIALAAREFRNREET